METTRLGHINHPFLITMCRGLRGSVCNAQEHHFAPVYVGSRLIFYCTRRKMNAPLPVNLPPAVACHLSRSSKPLRADEW